MYVQGKPIVYKLCIKAEENHLPRWDVLHKNIARFINNSIGRKEIANVQ
jgi:hypothetical protein